MNLSGPCRLALRVSVVALGFWSYGSLPAAEEVTLDRAARDYKLPDQIQWRGKEDGPKTATLFGDPSKPGLYVQLLKRPPNNWSGPHKHDHDRFITVLEGTMWIGTGTDFDKEKTVALHKGGFVRDIANQIHYDGSKDDGLTIEVVGITPPK
ncbi:MAG TPA: cupin domain-containing protein [Bryobacteraceae bacterium]|jgi:quercetin dioxygenase-like cupin family protein|nr:cupin domain-containing protein [Bryobacteraceae bacterium]